MSRRRARGEPSRHEVHERTHVEKPARGGMRHEMDGERIEGRAGKNAHETVAEDLGKRRDAEAGMDRRFARVVPLVRESVRCGRAGRRCGTKTEPGVMDDRRPSLGR